jgi:hypothetical protein
VCIDCIAEGVDKYRPTPHGGPRSPLCVTHKRARKRKARLRAYELHIEHTYELSIEEYDAILAEQGGACPCGRAKGITKRLAVDHDHHFHDGEDPPPHPPEVGCRRCVRGLLCDTCNRIVVGRYDVAALARLITYKTNPPARRVICPDCGHLLAEHSSSGLCQHEDDDFCSCGDYYDRP